MTLAAAVRRAQAVVDAPSATLAGVAAALASVCAALPPGDGALSRGEALVYTSFAEHLLGTVSVDWLSALPEGERRRVFDAYFLDAPASAAFCSLVAALDTLRDKHTFALQTCVRLLRLLLTRERGWDRIFHSSRAQDQRVVVQYIASLPDRLANLLKGDVRGPLQAGEYFTGVGMAILAALQQRRPGRGVDHKLLASLISKAVVLQHGAAAVVQPLLTLLDTSPDDPAALAALAALDEILPRLSASALELFVVQCLATFPNTTRGRALLQRLAGLDGGSSRLRRLYAHKLLFVRFFRDSKAAALVVHVLGCCTLTGSRGEPLLVEVLGSVAEVWGEMQHIQGTSYDRHLYLSRLLVLGCRALGPEARAAHGPSLMMGIVSGVQGHLSSQISPVRLLGMATAELVTGMVTPDSAEFGLQFSYEPTPDIEELRSLGTEPVAAPEAEAGRPAGPEVRVTTGFDAAGGDSDGGETDEDDPDAPFFETDFQAYRPVAAPEESDSDDELPAYAMDEEELDPVLAKAPVYIRDCIEGLRAKDDPERVEGCLRASAGLMQRLPTDFREVSVELFKALLHLENSYALDDFNTLRLGALTCAVALAPEQVTPYATEQFYLDNYSIRHRLDILDALRQAANELARTDGEAKAPEPAAAPPPGQGKDSETMRAARLVIEDRLRAKTRRFVSKRAPPPAGKPNRFAPVAGLFFYPLLSRFDRPIGTLNLLESDSMVLAPLVRTVSIVLHCAGNSPRIVHMASVLIEFLLRLRYHPDPGVRRSICFSVTTVCQTVPFSLLVSELMPELRELQLWLQETYAEDPDGLCRELALAALLLIHRQLEALREQLGD